MLTRESLRRALGPVALYTCALTLCGAVLVKVLDLRKANLNVPFRYRGDVLLIHMWSKEILDHGWYLHNASIGAPFPGPPE